MGDATGMLWYIDNRTAKDFAWPEAITAACEYYYNKYKRFPTVVRMCPADFESAGLKRIANVRLVGDGPTLPNHLLISAEGK